MSERPRIRPVEAFPIQQEGKTLICLRDPLRFAQPLIVTPVAYFILSHFDGGHDVIDIQEAYSRRFGQILFAEELRKFIDLLDEHHYLFSDRFLEHQQQTVRAFQSLPTRPPAHAGAVYRENPAELKAQLEGYFQAPGGPGKPDHGLSAPTPRAIVAPHIDFHRGGPCYAWAYRALAEAPGADLYIVLGTSHCGGDNPFTATLKDFDTPLGTVETDKEFVRRLQESSGGELFAEEFLHRSEHSIEFQVVFLKYVASWREELLGAQRPFKIVPILVSSFQSMVQSGTLPEKDSGTGDFLKALGGLVESEERKVCLVAGVDLAHVGMQFGDREPITPEFLKWVEGEDLKLIERLAAADAEGFFHQVAKDQDRRRICGFAPLYSLIHLLDGSRGRCLKYSQAFTPDTGSAVTFAGMVFE